MQLFHLELYSPSEKTDDVLGNLFRNDEEYEGNIIILNTRNKIRKREDGKLSELYFAKRKKNIMFHKL